MKQPAKTKIMIFGTFDHFHKGHENLIAQARRLVKNSFLIISVARDVNVKKIKGRKPDHTENKRAAFIKKTKLADKVVLGSKTDYLHHIVKEQPEVIALGYDQLSYTEGLKQALKAKGLHVRIRRLKAYKPNRYKSSIVKKQLK